jgi:hypothetical protein
VPYQWRVHLLSNERYPAWQGGVAEDPVPDALAFAAVLLSTLRYAENVGIQLHSLRQRLLPIRSPAGSGAAQKANSGGLLQLELWTGTPPEGSGTFSPEPIFSEPLDSANLVQRFEGLRDSAF